MRAGLQLARPLAAVAVVALTVAATAYCLVLHVPGVAFAMLAPTVLSPNHAMPAELCHHHLVRAGALFVPSGGAFIYTIHAMWFYLPLMAHVRPFPPGMPAAAGVRLQVRPVY